MIFKTPTNQMLVFLSLAKCGVSRNFSLMVVLLSIAFFFAGSCNLSPKKNEMELENSLPKCVEKLLRVEIFARIATDVRFFHPSDEVVATNWDNFLAASMSKVANASPDTFPEILRGLFAEIAPTLVINGKACGVGQSIPSSDHFIQWEQNGYSEEKQPNPETSAFQRTRIIVSAKEKIKNSTYRTEYRGIKIEIPLVLSVDKKNASLPLASGGSALTYPAPQAFDQYNCMAAVATVWGVMQNYFPYFPVKNVVWENELAPLLESCFKSSEEKMFLALRSSLTKLGDNHLVVMNNGRDLPVFTVPVAFSWVEGKVLAVYQKEKTESSIKIGDELVSVDEEEISKIFKRWLPLSLRSPHRAYDEIALGLVRRAEGAKVALKLKNQSGVTYQADLAASELWGQMYQAGVSAYSFNDKPHIKLLDGDILYVNLSSIKTEEVESTILHLQKAKAAILDLRNYPADFMGWWNILAHFSSKNISSLPMFYHVPTAPNRLATDVVRIEQEISPLLPRIKIPVVALSSKFSISQNEHALGFVQIAGIPILGEKTFGINGNTVNLNVFGGLGEGIGFTVAFTGLEVRQHDQSKLIGVGIIPNIEVSRSQEGIRTNDDEQLEAAVKFLLKKIPAGNRH